MGLSTTPLSQNVNPLEIWSRLSFQYKGSKYNKIEVVALETSVETTSIADTVAMIGRNVNKTKPTKSLPALNCYIIFTSIEAKKPEQGTYLGIICAT
jgi:hypothetical protein